MAILKYKNRLAMALGLGIVAYLGIRFGTATQSHNQKYAKSTHGHIGAVNESIHSKNKPAMAGTDTHKQNKHFKNDFENKISFESDSEKAAYRKNSQAAIQKAIEELFSFKEKDFNQPPVIFILTRDNPNRQHHKTLDARMTHDPEGGPVLFYWQILDCPDGAHFQLSSASDPLVEIDTNKGGEYSVALTAYDEQGASTTSIRKIKIPHSAEELQVIIDGPAIAVANATLQLDGSKTKGPPEETLSYSWRLLSTPKESQISKDTLVNGTAYIFTPDAQGIYEVELLVTASGGEQGKNTHLLVVHDSSASALAQKFIQDMAVNVGERVPLSSKKIALPPNTSWIWSFVFKPPSSLENIREPNTDHANLRVDVPGIYIVRLILINNQREIFTGTVRISANLSSGKLASTVGDRQNNNQESKSNDRRVAKSRKLFDEDEAIFIVLKADSQACPSLTHPIELNAKETISSNGLPLKFEWKITKAPKDSTAKLIRDHQPDAALFVDKKGDFEVELTVRTSSGLSASQKHLIRTFEPRLKFPIKPIDLGAEYTTSSRPEDYGNRVFYSTSSVPTDYVPLKDFDTTELMFTNLEVGKSYDFELRRQDPSARGQNDLKSVDRIAVELPQDHMKTFYYWHTNKDKLSYTLSPASTLKYPEVHFRTNPRFKLVDEPREGTLTYEITQRDTDRGVNFLEITNFDKKSQSHYLRFQYFHKYLGDLLKYEESPPQEFRMHTLRGLHCFEYVGPVLPPPTNVSSVVPAGE